MSEIKLLAATYCRVSTLLGQDIAHQLTPIQQFAAGRGLSIVASYDDEGISGTKMRRPGLDRLIRDARLGKFKVVIVAALDRIGRNLVGTLELFLELQHYGVAVISLREAIDFTTPMGKATLAIFAAIAELEGALTRERIRTALAVKKLAAEKSGSGWRSGRPSVITPEITARVRELRDAGLSIRQIEKAIEKKVSRASIERILKAVTKPAS